MLHLLGRGIMMGTDSTPYKITGICKDVPENSHLSFDLLLSYITLYTGPDSWKEADYDFTDSDFWHYIQLKHGTDYKALEAKFPAFSQRHFQGNKISGSDEKFYLQPLSKAHLYSDFEYEIGETASSTVVWGIAHYCHAYYCYCMGELYQSCNSKINGACKRSGCKKSFRRNKTTIDKTISYRIFYHQYYCIAHCIDNRNTCSK